MATVTVQNAAKIESEGFSAEMFLQNARQYNKHQKGVDWIVSLKPDERENAIAEMLDTVESLELQSVHGKGYTPDTSLGFGSGNAATIADQILRRAATTAQTRKLFAGLGKPSK